MTNGTSAVIIAAGLVVLGLLALYIVSFLRIRLRHIKEVKIELGRAYTEAAHRHWKRELKAARLCLIPGVSVKLARKLAKKE